MFVSGPTWLHIGLVGALHFASLNVYAAQDVNGQCRVGHSNWKDLRTEQRTNQMSTKLKVHFP